MKVKVICPYCRKHFITAKRGWFVAPCCGGQVKLEVVATTKGLGGSEVSTDV